MNILVLNSGSSSLKFQLIDMQTERVLAKGLCERIGLPDSSVTYQAHGIKTTQKAAITDHSGAIQLVMQRLLSPEDGVIETVGQIAAVGHRVAHGGDSYSHAVLVDERVKQAIRDAFELGPLHNPANLLGIEACEQMMPKTPNAAVWDTAFGMGMPAKAYMYAIPYEYYRKYRIRRYGFHGTSHQYVSRLAAELAGLDPKTARIVVCHLGNGASVSASVGGVCVDSSMGLTPLEGLIMGTRSGDVDPAVIQLLCKKEDKSVDELLEILNKKSGILGLSGISSDFRDVEKESLRGDRQAGVAMEAFTYRVAKYIGAYTIAMNGTDAIAFTAGIGENDVGCRREICSYLGCLGVRLSDAANAHCGGSGVISAADSKIPVMVIPTNEELAIAKETARLIGA